MATSRRKRRKVFVGMSGGVDSSVAALLLKNEGYEVTGVYLKCWSQKRLDELGVPGKCPSERDAEDARRVANHLGIPFYVFDFEEEYRRRVVEYMIEGYRRGITPNPDVMCNREIKFGLFLEKALALGAKYVATGHYVRRLPVSQHRLSARSSDARQSALSPQQVAEGDTELAGAPRAAAKQEAAAWGLWEGKDKNKDQSYFLWTLTQAQLAHALFPIGDYLKPEVREMARQAGLPTAEKKDSQGICFLGDVALADFIARHIPDRPGDVVTVGGVPASAGASAGKKVGKHRGAHLYTIGQRHGLNLGKKIKEKGNAETQPYYISAIDVERNVVTVAEGSDNPALFREEVELTDTHFINEQQTTTNEQQVLARVRYRQPLVSAKLINLKLKTYKLVFDQPVKFVAPGQSAVFYSDEGKLIGGGVIAAS